MHEFDLYYMITNSSWIIKGVLLLLTVLSFLSWFLIFLKWMQIGNAQKGVTRSLEGIQGLSGFPEVLQRLRENPASPAHALAMEGVNEFNRMKNFSWPSSEKMKIMIESIRKAQHDVVNSQIETLYGSLSFLATCVNVAPFIGLFGTVWGIMHSFYVIGKMKSASLAMVAPGLSEALITTAFGLIVAIPATLAYNLLLRKLQKTERGLIAIMTEFGNRVKQELAARDKG